MSIVWGFIYNVGLLVTIWYGYYLVVNTEADSIEHISPGSLASFILYCQTVSGNTSAFG